MIPKKDSLHIIVIIVMILSLKTSSWQCDAIHYGDWCCHRRYDRHQYVYLFLIVQTKVLYARLASLQSLCLPLLCHDGLHCISPGHQNQNHLHHFHCFIRSIILTAILILSSPSKSSRTHQHQYKLLK